MQQAEILREPASETRVKSNRHATLFLTVSALLVLCSLCMPSLFTAGDITNRTDRAACAKAFRKSGCCPPLPAARKDRHPCRSLRGESAHQDRMRLPGAALPPSKLVAKAARSGEALMGGTRLPGSPPGAAASHSAVAITGRPISHNQNPKITAAPYEARGLHALSIEGCILKLCNRSSASLQHWHRINCRQLIKFIENEMILTGRGERSTRRRGPARRERCLLKLLSRALVILSLFSLCHSTTAATSAVAAGHARLAAAEAAGG